MLSHWWNGKQHLVTVAVQTEWFHFSDSSLGNGDNVESQQLCASSSSKKSTNDIWRPSRTHHSLCVPSAHLLSLENCWFGCDRAAVVSPFPSCHRHRAALSGYRCQSNWRAAILRLNACGPILFLLCLSWKINASAGCNKTPRYCS